MADRPNCFAVDYDGTIADTNFIKGQWIRENLGQVVAPWHCDRTSCVPIIGKEAYERMANAVYEREWSLKAPAVAGALDGLRALKDRGRVYVLTARLPHRLAFTREWLEMHGASDFSDALLSSADMNKALACETHGIDVLIDDDARHLLPVARQGVKAILLRPGFGGTLTLPPDIVLCRSWSEVLAQI